MLFNSFDFAIFLPIVFSIYWLLQNYKLKYQNLSIVLASYIFYGWWDYRFLGLILFSTIVDYGVGRLMSNTNFKAYRKQLLYVSIISNLGLLGVFKYYNFFVENFTEAFRFFGIPFEVSTLNIILPVGISFYTFQTLSYTIDVYRKKLDPTADFIAFTAFVSFFPQLVAGPIERATHLLPQFFVKRKFEYKNAVNGLRQILWGLLKKIVIADNCGKFADIIFNNSDNYSGSTLVLGAIFFTFQIYGDFSGYSDIAIGTSRLFSFDLRNNFKQPYFSRDIAEFWKRWHISLSSWFKDYLYIPLGGNRVSTIKNIRNVFIIFLVSGLWHGANWTFVVWGALNAIYFIPLLLTNRNHRNNGPIEPDRIIPKISTVLRITSTFLLTVFAWIFFRAESIKHAISYIKTIFSKSLFSFPSFHLDESVKPIILITIIFMCIEWFGRNSNYGIESLLIKSPKPIRWSFYILIIFIIFYFKGDPQEFIYFQF